MTEGTKRFKQKVANVAKQGYTYSKVAAQDAEEWFHKMESEYSEDLAVVRENPNEVPPRQQLALLLTIFDLHYRNARYDVPDELERIDVYKHWSAESLATEILGQPQPAELQEVADLTAEQWRTALLRSEEELITSDNPALLFHDGNNSRVTHCVLPISPHEALISYRVECIDLIRSDLTSKEAATLNGVIASQSIGQVYSAYEWAEDDMRKSGELREKYRESFHMDMQSMKPAFLRFEGKLDFIERKDDKPS